LIRGLRADLNHGVRTVLRPPRRKGDIMWGNGHAVAVIRWFPLALMLGACASVRQDTANGLEFANAGIVYTETVPAVIAESFRLTVEANSIQLSLARDTLSEQERSQQLALADGQLDRRRRLLDDLRTHAALLRDYFAALRTLVDTGNNEAIEAAARNSLSRLPGLQKAIAAREIAGVKLGGLLAPAAAMAVGGYRNSALRRELAERGRTIERELALQQAVMKALVEQMQDDAGFIATVKEVNPVYEQYVSARKLPVRWPDLRVKKFAQASRLKSLDELNQAADRMHTAWIAFVEKRDIDGGWGLFLQDIQHLLAVIGA